MHTFDYVMMGFITFLFILFLTFFGSLMLLGPPSHSQIEKEKFQLCIESGMEWKNGDCTRKD